MAIHPHIFDSEHDLLLVADHLSDHVPEEVDLGIPGHWLDKHIAVDIGVEALAHAVRDHLGCPAIHAGVSRLVVDLHRERDHPGVIPLESDGHAIPGNRALDEAGREERLRRYWDPYHDAVDRLVENREPQMLFTLHSFTPRLETDPGSARPWEVGILYNRDDRAPRLAMPMLERLGLTVGDNQPYSGRVLNATMNRHAEARGLPYLAIEVRNDLIGHRQGAEAWAALLAPVIAETAAALA